MLKMIGIFTLGSKKYFFIAVILSFAAIGFSMLPPLIIQYATDNVLQGLDNKVNAAVAIVIKIVRAVFGSNELLIASLALIFCALVNGVLQFTQARFMAYGSETLVKTARDTMFRHVLRLPFKWHTEHQTGDTIQRCTSDINATRTFVAQQLVVVLRSTITLGFGLFILITTNFRLSLSVIAFFPIFFLNTVYFSKKFAKIREAGEKTESNLTVDVQENLTGVRVVRAFGREEHELAKFNDLNEKHTTTWLGMAKQLSLFQSFSDFLAPGMTLVIVVAGAIMSVRTPELLTIGEIFAFVILSNQVRMAVNQLGRTLGNMSSAIVAMRRLRELLDNIPESEPETALKPPMNGDIVFRNVKFTYLPPEKTQEQENEERKNAENKNADDDEKREPVEVLKGLNLTIKGGSTLGILGATGSGKSTLTYLLTRLYDLADGGGDIRIGGIDVRDIDRFYLRENIGLVLQEPFLFSKNIADNIAITQKKTDLDAVRAKCRVASIDEDITAFEKGYDTMIGERGVTLSGGQKQRVAIARTLMKESPVVIFDDSMSALDMETDKQIRDALRLATGTATMIIISHRVATLMTADKIAVIEDGRVSEFGTHRQLVNLGGKYKRVYDIQSAVDLESREVM